MNFSKLEPFGIFSLASSLFYSMVICVTNNDSCNFKIHFIILSCMNLVALVSITLYKYLVQKFTCDKMNRLLASMKID